MNILILSINSVTSESDLRDNAADTSVPFFHFFDDVYHILQLNYFSTDFGLIVLYCKEVHDELRDNIAVLKQNLERYTVITASKSHTTDQVRKAFLVGADDFWAVNTDKDLIDYLQRTLKNQPYIKSKTINKQFENYPILQEQLIQQSQMQQYLLQDLLRGSFFGTQRNGRRIRHSELSNHSDYILVYCAFDNNIDAVLDSEYYNIHNIHNEFIYQYIDETGHQLLADVYRILLKQADGIYMLCYWTNKPDINSNYHITLTNFFNNLLARFHDHTGYTFSMGVSRIYHDVRLTYESAQEAKKSLNRRFYSGTATIYFYSGADSIEIGENVHLQREENLSLLEELLRNSDEKSICNYYRGLCRTLKKYQLPQNKVIASMTTILNRLNFIVNNLGFELPLDLDETAKMEEQMNSLSTYDQLVEYFILCITNKLDVLRMIKFKPSSSIEKALDLINKGLGSDLSLKTVADMVHLSPNYLSELFKKEVNINFHEYVLQKRIHEAKLMLLNTNKTISEIYLQVGFQDSVSFNRNFKKICSVTPSAYRKKARVSKINQDLSS